MSLSPGERLGPYEILALIGAGGMGEVYRARDTRLDRVIAIKVSSQRFSERFEREARTVASFNHPNICTVHDVGPDYLVMEYVDGVTLAERLTRGRLPFEQTLTMAIQIAGALDTAHCKGIVHRDLKPANIMITKSGVKVLDFGLAKVTPVVGDDKDTLTGITRSNAIVGTLKYMSPEQLQAREADARSDIFSFGLVFYEMLTGHRAFQGDSTAAAIGATLHAEPAPGALPEPVKHICLTCLAKDPDDRWQSARDLRRELEWLVRSKMQEEPDLRASSRKWKIATAACAVLGLALAALGIRNAPHIAEEVYHVTIRTPKLDVSDGGRIALSPDGRQIAMITVDDAGAKHLMIRMLDSDGTHEVASADDVQNYPFWSPDGRSIGYFSTDSLNKVDLTTGKVTKLARAAAITRGGSWANGQILFVSNASLGISRITESGGEPEQVTFPDDGPHTYPQFLPDGRFLFTAMAKGKAELRLGTSGSRETRSLGIVYGNVAVASASLLVFRRAEALVAQRVDPKTLAFIGPPVSLIEDVRYTSINGFGTFAVSSNGVLAFRRGGDSKTLLRWFDREGRRLSEIGGPGAYWSFDLSRDESKIAVSRSDPEQNKSNIWVGDVNRGPVSRLSRDTGTSAHPVWSPDGQRVCFASIRDGHPLLLMQDASGVQKEQVLSEGPERIAHLDWSHDGRFLAFTAFSGAAGAGRGEIRSLNVNETKQPISLLSDQKISFIMPQFSVDGHWLAYVSNESGPYEVYVRPFPELTRGKWQVSSGGGLQPRWRADGREMFYLDSRSRVVSVPVTPQVGVLKIGGGKQLFHATVPFSLLARFEYAVSRDGQRILANILAEEEDRSVDLFIHWDALLR